MIAGRRKLRLFLIIALTLTLGHSLYCHKGVMKMKISIGEFAKLTGVSIKTLHYYDKVELLKPAYIDKNSGYRYYDENSLAKMEEILFYRELDFSLAAIKEMLSSPGYDRSAAIRQQKHLLTLKKERIEALIAALDRAEKGESAMKAFDNSKYETARRQYEKEAKERWGHTDAYKEYERKAPGADAAKGLEDIMAEFAAAMTDGAASNSEAAVDLVEKLRRYISENFYTCTKEILKGLGQMYVADERFKANIDQHAPGTAEFISQAIENYCK